LDASARDVVNPGASRISSQLFESYLECFTKCWLRSGAEPATGNVYAEWIRAQKETYLRDRLKRLLQSPSESDCVTAPPIPKNAKDVTWRLAIDVRWKQEIWSLPYRLLRDYPLRTAAGLRSSSLIGSNPPTNLPRNISCYSRSMHSCCRKWLDAR
jgi:hypothetical protein